ncbi:MAG TPA: hypothetical protein VEJ87_16880, partial [Acidimicrobiales bacterium]|nr:hypothetical protein [Acidimicrobiales bacterium]
RRDADAQSWQHQTPELATPNARAGNPTPEPATRHRSRQPGHADADNPTPEPATRGNPTPRAGNPTRRS